MTLRAKRRTDRNIELFRPTDAVQSLKPLLCQCCGAPLHGNICEYCGVEYYSLEQSTLKKRNEYKSVQTEEIKISDCISNLSSMSCYVVPSLEALQNNVKYKNIQEGSLFVVKTDAGVQTYIKNLDNTFALLEGGI